MVPQGFCSGFLKQFGSFLGVKFINWYFIYVNAIYKVLYGFLGILQKELVGLNTLKRLFISRYLRF